MLLDLVSMSPAMLVVQPDSIYTRSGKCSPKNKDLGMACTSYSTPQKSKETRGNAIT